MLVRGAARAMCQVGRLRACTCDFSRCGDGSDADDRGQTLQGSGHAEQSLEVWAEEQDDLEFADAEHDWAQRPRTRHRALVIYYRTHGSRISSARGPPHLHSPTHEACLVL